MSDEFFEPGHVYKVGLVGATDLLMQMNAALPLLLAVAKAAEWQEDPKSREQYETRWYCSVCQRIKDFGHMEECLYFRLDLAHPDWRTWQP